MLDLTSFSFSMNKSDGFLIITYDTDKEYVFNIGDNLTYEIIQNSTDELNIIKNQTVVRLDYTKCTSHVENTRALFLHDLRKLINTHIKDFSTELALGNIAGSKVNVKFGENFSLGITKATIWSQGGTWTPLVGITGETMDIVSTSVQDVAVTGTGARILQITGLTTGDISLTENINLNGTTIVTTTNKFTFIYRAITLYAGSNENNEGDITLTASTSLTVQSQIPTNSGITQQVIYKAPVNNIAQVKSGTVAIINDNGVNAKVTFEIWFRYPTGVKIRTLSIFLDSLINPFETVKNEVSQFLPEGTIIEMMAYSDKANTKVSASIDLIVQDKYS